MAAVYLSAGWLWRDKRVKTERGRSRGEKEPRGESARKAIVKETGGEKKKLVERKRGRQQEYSLCTHPRTGCLAFGHEAPEEIPSPLTPSVHSAPSWCFQLFVPPSCGSFPLLSTHPSVLNVKLLIWRVSGAAASSLQQNPLWQATNSPGRGEPQPNSAIISPKRGRKV